MFIGRIDNMSIPLARLYARTLIIIMLAFSITHCVFLASRPEVPTVESPFSENVIQEVSSVIVKFETLWLSEQSHRDPTFQAELATGEYLDRFGYKNLFQSIRLIWLN